MNKTIAILTFLVFGAAVQLSAQKVWTDPVDYKTPTDSVTIYVDLTMMDCDKLVGNAGPLYLWTWMPADPVVGNGDWTASNTDLAMTSEGNDIWSFTMLPTDFYNVTAQDVFDSDIFFLVKGLDGGSGGDCSSAGDENKTEDLTLVVDPPGLAVKKVFGFPAPSVDDSIFISSEDIFTLFYNNGIEEKASMQNPGDLFVYARAYDKNGNEYRPSTFNQAGNNPALKMTADGSLYNWSIIPKNLFNIPDTETLDFMRLQIIKPVVVNSDDAVDGLFDFYIRCD
jgi:hypothetical protein